MNAQPAANVELVLVEPGRRFTHRGRRGQAREIVIDRVWDVIVDDQIVGQVEYVMVTRETRSAGRRYVNDRWQSPGWRYKLVDGHHWFEPLPSTKKAAVEQVVDSVR